MNNEKNIAIAKMLGWEEHKGWLIHSNAKSIYGSNMMLTSDLKFDSDANWQFEAIEYIQKNHFYWVDIFGSGLCTIKGMVGKTKNPHISVASDDIKEAIFETLYQFSTFIKNENEKADTKTN